MRIIGGTHRGTHLTDVRAGDVEAHYAPPQTVCEKQSSTY